MKTILTNRNKLFYDKYQYKVLVDLPGARYLKWKQNFDKFIKQLTERGYLDEHDCNDVVLLDFHKKVMDFYNEFKSNKEVTFLHEYSFLGVYTSSVDIIQEILNIDPTFKVYKAVTPPQKIMYFAKEPKYKYRVYLKSTRATESLIKSLDDFRKTYNNGVYLSGGLVSFIRTSNWKKRFYSYLHGSFFIDFNDDSMLTFMHLLIGECLGKTYKLEKRP